MASFPNGVNQLSIPKRVNSTKDVPFGVGRAINVAMTDMMFLAKSEVYREAASNGRPLVYETPEILLHACVEYFYWCEENPLLERVTNFAAKTGSYHHTDVPRRRPYTQKGLCLYLGIGDDMWLRYGKDERFKTVVKQVNSQIYDQKFSGAATGFFNATIIARDLGLADKTEVTGAGGGPVQKITTEMTPEEAAEMYAKTREG